MRAADLTPVARDVLRLPAGLGLVLASFLAAFLFNSLPWSGWALSVRPDLVLLVLLFWTIHQPASVGQGIAFAVGLAMDVGDAMLLGQHALAYTLATYGAQVLRVRVLSFGLVEQSLHVLGLATGAAATMVLLNLLLGADLPGPSAALAPLLAALAWGPLNWLLYLPALRRSRGDASA